jgi:hypothetical protein
LAVSAPKDPQDLLPTRVESPGETGRDPERERVRDQAKVEGRAFTLLEGWALSLIAALAGTAVVGYRFGDSNHGITVPILKRFMDPSLYPGDVMVATADKFPTIFFPLLARILPGPDWIPFAFFIGYVASIAATLAAAYRIGRWAGGTMEAGLVTAAFTFPVRVGLAGEAVYRTAFSHSHVASALVLWAIVWFLEGRRLLPLLVLSLGAYNHLLYSAYMLVPFTLVVLAEAKARGRRETLKLLAAAVVPLLPLAVMMLGKSTPMTPQWLELLRTRSAHHSSPSTWGDQLPAAVGFLLLGLLSASTASSKKQRIFGIFLAGIALQFVVGTVFMEIQPVKAVLQFQPHRCWRFLLVVLYGWIAAGVVAGWRQGGLARIASVFTFFVVFVANGFEPLLPAALVLGALLRRDAAPWARLAIPVALALVPGIGEGAPNADMLHDYSQKLFTSPALLGASLLIVLVVARQAAAPLHRKAAAAVVLALAVLGLGPHCYRREQVRWESGSWREIQNWVRLNTPKTAVFLTPPKGNDQAFRVFSERTIVGEWKDGTQQYFDDAFVREWGKRMADLAGGEDKDPAHFTDRSDAELLELAARYGASYIVLPSKPERALLSVYGNRHYTVYRARPR